MKSFIGIILFIITVNVFGQYQGPIPELTNGYGSEGSSEVSVINITNDHFLLKKISVFYPSEITSPVPTIYFSHGYGGNDTTNYIETLRNLASNGYAVVFVPYKTIGVTVPERYLTLSDGFIKASRNLSNIIDTTQVGFFGHSFGGGATPALAYKLFTENNWGANGKFIYCSAPWYSYELETTNLSNFPTDCNMLMLLFENDDVNDHRIGMDIFNNISINDSIKDCITVHADTVSDYIYESNHGLPAQNSLLGTYDAHDYYVTFRLLGALADYTFTGNLNAKEIALGNGSPSQIIIGDFLTPLTVSDNPSPIHPESYYENPCTDERNERQAFCQTILGTEAEEINHIEIFPNPSYGNLKVNYLPSHQQISISIFTIAGEEILSNHNQNEIDISKQPAGAYLAHINIDGRTYTKKILKTE